MIRFWLKLYEIAWSEVTELAANTADQSAEQLYRFFGCKSYSVVNFDVWITIEVRQCPRLWIRGGRLWEVPRVRRSIRLLPAQKNGTDRSPAGQVMAYWATTKAIERAAVHHEWSAVWRSDTSRWQRIGRRRNNSNLDRQTARKNGRKTSSNSLVPVKRRRHHQCQSLECS